MTRPQHVVVVAYGAEDALDRALGALERAVEITVVDNSTSEAVRAVANRRGAEYVEPADRRFPEAGFPRIEPDSPSTHSSCPAPPNI